MEDYVIELNGVIYNGYNGRDYLNYFLSKAGGKPVRLKVNSYGGDVNQAIAMSKLLEENGNVTVEFIGFNASAATWLAFGAKNIEIHEDAMWLAHKCATYVDAWGTMNADEIQRTIEELTNQKKSNDAIDLMIASKYADRCKKPIKDVMDLMKEARWMSASEALTWGFVDKVIPGINKTAKVNNQLIANLVANGLPEPATSPTNEDEKPVTQGFIKTLFNGFKQKKDTSELIENTTMNKTYEFVNKILNCEGVEEKEGKITLTNEQITLINNALKSAENRADVAEKAKESAENSLKEATDSIDGLSDQVKNAADMPAKVNVIKNILDKVPGISPSNHTPQGDPTNKFKEVAVDPINQFDEY